MSGCEHINRSINVPKKVHEIGKTLTMEKRIKFIITAVK